ncbi:hypothetical protein [Erythrobacter sp.]|uniref:hypothetical protein n=1 Tax=Erythrobacter sp. TaxID=1042 RepID=UPI001425C8B1|nr:hypothetical protein [Erythrobacter sp.]QIQ85304.1 MAG: hypothetical protein G9473_00375 [Erythrobacter sp.]
MSDGRLGAPIGRRPVGQGWRIFLWLAAAFNFVVGLLAMLSPEADVDARLVGLLIFAFGVVYFQAARDPERLAPVLWGGVIAKVGTAALFAPLGFGADGSLLVASAVVIDGLFAVGFLAFLLSRGGDL